MKELTRGERLPLAPDAAHGVIDVHLEAQGATLDFACFAIDAAGRLADDRYMTFFNQPASPCGGVTLAAGGTGSADFRLRLDRLPAALQRVVVTAASADGTPLSRLQAGELRLAGVPARFAFAGRDFAGEQAVMLGEFYRRDGGWRFMAVGQGFDGGLAALVRHFGAEVAPAAAAPAPPPAAVNLEKRVAQAAPQLVDLVKHAGVSLSKVGLDKHRARVCLVLDISASMSQLYRKGLVQRFAERILALGCRFDDDGEIDVFLFGRDVHAGEPMGLANWSDYVNRLLARHPLEGDTRYGAAMEAVRRHYFPAGVRGPALPVYVMFVTDGNPSDAAVAERALRAASREPIFWQFMGIGRGRKAKGWFGGGGQSDFPFLEKLDDLDGRFLDNADFFAVASPDEHLDAALYDLLMTEYPGWVREATKRGLLG